MKQKITQKILKEMFEIDEKESEGVIVFLFTKDSVQTVAYNASNLKMAFVACKAQALFIDHDKAEDLSEGESS